MASEFGSRDIRPVSELCDDCRQDAAEISRRFRELEQHQRRYDVECETWALYLARAEKQRRYALGCLENCADPNVIREAQDPKSPLFKTCKLDEVESAGRIAYGIYKLALVGAEGQKVKELLGVSLTAEQMAAGR